MTKLQVAYPDAENEVVDLLEALLASHEPTVTVGVGVPEGWTPESPAHVQVAWDGTPLKAHPVVAHATIRLVARAATTQAAKELVALCEGLLLAHEGNDPIAVIRSLTGVLPARDSETRAELASVTVRVTVRSEPIEVS